MSTGATNRLLVLGIDGLPPHTLDRFRHEGLLPHWDRAHKAGARLSLKPPLPPLTAPAWMTIASGAHPATLGVTSILQPRRGEAPNRVFNGFDRRGVAAEYLWDGLARDGQCAVVVKFPGSWPPRTPGVIQVDGAGGYADITCRFDIVESLLYSSDGATTAPSPRAVPGGYGEHWRIDDGASPGVERVTARAPLGWHGLPENFEAAFEVVLPVASRQSSRRGSRTVLTAVAGHYGKGSPPTLWVTQDKRIDDDAVELRVGQWSPWISQTFGQQACQFRLKLRTLDLEANSLRLYRSAGHAREGFTQPQTLARELERQIGPVVEWTGTFDVMNSLVDLDTQLEIYDQHTTWLEDALLYLSDRYPWRALFTQWHVVEYAHHIAGSALSHEHPHHHVRRDELLSFLRETYRLSDRLVGTARRLVNTDDTLVVLGDHGHALVHTLFFLNALLLDEGWLFLHDDASVDWTRTRAYGLYPGFIVLNSKTHWPQGVVETPEIPRLLSRLTQLLRAVRDPRTGQHPISAVIPRGEMDAWGQDGPGAPDLYFSVDEGYEVASRLPSDGAMFHLTEPGKELTSGHGSFHPSSRAVRTLALFEGPLFEPAAQGRSPAEMVDLAPTFAEILHCPAPANADGRPLSLQRLGIARGLQ